MRFELTDGYPSPVFKTGALNQLGHTSRLARGRDSNPIRWRKARRRASTPPSGRGPALRHRMRRTWIEEKEAGPRHRALVTPVKRHVTGSCIRPIVRSISSYCEKQCMYDFQNSRSDSGMALHTSLSNLITSLSSVPEYLHPICVLHSAR